MTLINKNVDEECKMKKRLLSLLLASVMLATCLTACGKNETSASESETLEEVIQETESEIESEIEVEKVQFLERDELADMIVEAGFLDNRIRLSNEQEKVKREMQETTENGMTCYTFEGSSSYFTRYLPQTVAVIMDFPADTDQDSKRYRIDILQNEEVYNVVYREQIVNKDEVVHVIKFGQLDEETLVALYNQRGAVNRGFEPVSNIEEIIENVTQKETRVFPSVTQEGLYLEVREWLADAIVKNGNVADIQAIGNLSDEDLKSLFMAEQQAVWTGAVYCGCIGTNDYHIDEDRAYTIRKLAYETEIKGSVLTYEFVHFDDFIKYDILKMESGQYVCLTRTCHNEAIPDWGKEITGVSINVEIFDSLEDDWVKRELDDSRIRGYNFSHEADKKLEMMKMTDMRTDYNGH